MKASAGVLYEVTALFSGYIAFYMMMQTVNGGPWSWWGPIMFGAAILLMVAGVRAFFPRLKIVWLLTIAAATPLAICSVFGTWPFRCWAFAAILSLSTWIAFKIEADLHRSNIAAFASALILALSWAVISKNTLSDYLAPRSPNMNPAQFVVLLFVWIVIIGTLVRSGKTLLGRQ